MNHLSRARSAMVPRQVSALGVSAALAVAGCGGSVAPSPSASLAAVDPCLVGTWTVVGQTQDSPANDEQISYSGGAGEVFSIDASGAVTIDTQAAEKIVFVSAGETFSATVSGTGRGTLSTYSLGPDRAFDFKPSADDTRKTLSLDSTGSELGPARPDTAFSAVYTCAPGRFTFYKSAVNYMVDGPIVELTSRNGAASSAASP
jgi:hypothetical protein